MFLRRASFSSLHLQPHRRYGGLPVAKYPGETTDRTVVQCVSEDPVRLLQWFRSAGLLIGDFCISGHSVTCRLGHHTSDTQLAAALAQLATERDTVAPADALATMVTVQSSTRTPFFPTSPSELGRLALSTLVGGKDLLNDDHPGFKDQNYLLQRQRIAKNAADFKQGNCIPDVEYSPEENRTWATVNQRLMALYPRFACAEHLASLRLFARGCGMSAGSIPQLQTISRFLYSQTGFSLRPVQGLLEPRDFLYHLAFRQFASTQYIRHHSKPLYTPEPDICHELLGHCPMLLNPEFADFTQAIGLASLGASDEDIERLATCYWFSVEFGLCRQDGKLRAYGAGLLSSFGEMEHALGPRSSSERSPDFRAWDPFAAADQDYPITTYQPVYYVAESFADARAKLRAFTDSINRPFTVRHNAFTNSVIVTEDPL